MNIWHLSCISIFLCSSSCGNKKNTETSVEMASEKTETQSEPFRASTALQIDKVAFQSAMMNTSAESEPWIEGDKLHIPVNYAACFKHKDWMLVGSPIWMKSLPPQKPIRLIRGNIVEEMCPDNDGIRETLVFDITSARFPGQNRVVLNLVGDREFRIEYVYEAE